MNLRIITQPTTEPVSIETLKAHLRIDSNVDDVLLAAYLKSARELGEGLARRAFITQTLELYLDTWPCNGMVKLPRPPLQSVVSVKYKDENGVESTWTNYIVDERTEPGVIYFKTVPSTALYESGAIAVRFVAGYGDTPSAVPGVFAQGILLTVSHWYENREGYVNAQLYEIPLGVRPLFLSDRGS